MAQLMMLASAVYVLEVILGVLVFIAVAFFVLGVATEFFTGVRPNWAYLIWGLSHPKARRELETCQCFKPGAQWLLAKDTTGEVNGAACPQCGRWITPYSEPDAFHSLIASLNQEPIEETAHR